MHKTTAQEFAESVADYMETHRNYESLTKRDVVIEAIRVLTDDRTAAQQFLHVIGLDLNLYETDNT